MSRRLGRGVRELVKTLFRYGVPSGSTWRSAMARILVVAVTLPLLAGCSSAFTARSCAVDDDCGDGLVCAQQAASTVCLAAADAPLHIGMSAPVSGPNQALGTDMKLGILLAFDEQNAAGGVRGRKLVLDFRDDAYQPALAEENARDLIEVKPRTGAVKCPTTTTPAVAGQDPI